jgi:hypothetical protein
VKRASVRDRARRFLGTTSVRENSIGAALDARGRASGLAESAGWIEQTGAGVHEDCVTMRGRSAVVMPSESWQSTSSGVAPCEGDAGLIPVREPVDTQK